MKLLLRYVFILLLSLCVTRGSYAQPSAPLTGQARIDSLLKKLSIAKDDTNKVRLLNSLSFAYNNIDAETGVKYGQDELALAETLDFKQGIALANGIIGLNYMILSDYTKSLEYYTRALNQYEELQDKNGIAVCFGNIGNIYFYQSNYPKSLDYHLKALKLHEELNDKKGVAGSMGNIGNIYINLGNYPKALEYYFKVLSTFEELGLRDDVALTMGNIANVYANQNNYPKALEYSFKALKIDEELGRKRGIASNLSNIAGVYSSQSNYSTSLEYYFKALKMFEEIGDKHGVAVNLGNIGESYFTMAADTVKIKPDERIPVSKAGKLKKSIEFIKKGIAMCKELGDLNDLQNYEQDLSNAQAMMNDYKDALESFKQYEALNDSVFGKENEIKILNQETKREIDLKNKQIEIDKLAVAKKKNERLFYITGIGLLLLVIIFMMRNYYSQKRSNVQLSKEKQRSDDLLLNILPAEVADELKNKGTAAARHFDNVTVIFTDFVDFTQAGERMSPQALIDELHACFMAFDEIITRHNIEKIKTIGDAYLAVAGLPVADVKHAEHVVAAAIEINTFMQQRQQEIQNMTFEVRIGVHSGSVVAGIVGVKKFAYDIWGDTVNTTARMEEHSSAGKINISQTTYELVKDKFTCTYRGEIEAKNKGRLKMYYVES